ncbi:MAG: anti-sigma factor [Deltaproteobacteria bacterium HGW-Deltaproteobacteria-14]|jgi:anti-sigma factor RsiW|nr:MAG: anti-sigma factor [Deltaproteobacteria bacterium HGW-Deltaproteobacteria-14]
MLSCQELTELVTAYLEGRLGLLDRLRFRMHIGMCQHCRTYLREQKLVIAAVGHLPAEPIPDGVRDELLDRFRDWKGEDPKP